MIRLSVHPQCPFLYCVDDTVVFPLNNTFSVHTTDQASCVEVATVRDIVLYWALNIANSAQTFTSCCSFPMITDGSNTGLLASCLQTNSGNRCTQWLSVLCQYCWNQSCHFSTSEIYMDAFSVFVAWLNLNFGFRC